MGVATPPILWFWFEMELLIFPTIFLIFQWKTTKSVQWRLHKIGGACRMAVSLHSVNESECNQSKISSWDTNQFFIVPSSQCVTKWKLWKVVFFWVLCTQPSGKQLIYFRLLSVILWFPSLYFQTLSLFIFVFFVVFLYFGKKGESSHFIGGKVDTNRG